MYFYTSCTVYCTNQASNLTFFFSGQRESVDAINSRKIVPNFQRLWPLWPCVRSLAKAAFEASRHAVDPGTRVLEYHWTKIFR